ncbi:hypothetical protein ACFZCT_03400 [Streptomyces qaidamensis]|uniref:hypothetical protein n=1 Tax=Streptomyces qaidamensis TaxID=1783515 RepID=UPI0036ECACC6
MGVGRRRRSRRLTASSTTQRRPFGYGIHQWLRRPPARVELQVALPTRLRRLPGRRPAVPLEELRLRHDMAVYGVRELLVAW